MRTLALTTAIAAVLTATLAGPPPARADDPKSCQGRPATIVGKRHQPVTGTPGDDVIVADQSRSIDAGDGDDLVCASNGSTDVRLGAGADVFAGSGAGFWRLDTGDGDDLALGRSPSVDTVTTERYGAARVVSGVPGEPDGDIVSLGGDINTLTVRGWPTGAFSAATPKLPIPGQLNKLKIIDAVPHAWAVDGSLGTVSIDGGAPTVLSGYHLLDVGHLTWSSFNYVGSDAPDVLRASGPAAGPGPLTASMGGSYDFVTLGALLTGSLDGGDGEDGLHLVGRHSGIVAGHLELRLGDGWSLDGQPRMRVSGLEEANVELFDRIDVTGTAGDDYLTIRGCRARAAGAGGDDFFDLDGLTRCPHGQGRFVVRGGTGNDDFSGGREDDVLLGGPGRDRAVGGGGRDRCVAERREECER